MLTVEMPRRDMKDLGLLTALIIVSTWLLIGDFAVWLANSVGDDSPAVFSRILLDPSLFAGDTIAPNARVYALGTIIHWGPALLLRFVGIAPEATSMLLVYLQNVLLGCAVWLVARAAGEDRTTAWMASLFTLAAEVYIWNLASFRSQMAVPYGAHLALSFLLLAVFSLLRARNAHASGWLCLAAVTHPTMTLLSLPPIALALMWSDRRWKQNLRRTAIVIVPCTIAIAVTVLLVRSTDFDLMSAQDQLAAMRGNVHMNPFSTMHFWTVLMPTAATFVVMVSIAVSRLSHLQPFYRALLAMAVLVMSGYAIAHVIAVRLGIIPVLTLIPLRFMSILVVWSMPLCMGALLDRIRNGDVTARWATGALLILHPLSPLGAYWPALVSLLLGERWKIVKAMLLVGWLAAAVLLMAGSNIGGPLLFGSRISPSVLTAGLALSGVIAVLPRIIPGSRWLQPVPVLILLMPLLLLARSAIKGAETRGGAMRDLYDAQHWARRSTPAGAAFIIEPNISWRSISQRSARQVWPADAYVYSRSKASYDYARAVKAQHARAPFRNEVDVLEFRKRFGGDYLVRHASRPPIFRQVFRNDEFAIYELPESSY